MGVLVPLFLFWSCLSATGGSSLVLDVSNVDRTSINFSRNVDFRLVKDIFVPRKGNLIERVIDGAATVWSSSSGEFCSMVSLATRDGYSPLLHLVVEGDTLNITSRYYKKTGNSWSQVNEAVYQKQFKEMSLREVTLDISHPYTAFTRVGMDEGLLNVLEIKIMEGYKVVKLMDGQENVWEAQPGEMCSSLFIPQGPRNMRSMEWRRMENGMDEHYEHSGHHNDIHYSLDGRQVISPALIYLSGIRSDEFQGDTHLFFGNNGRTFNLYFEKRGDSWTRTSIFDYHTRLGHLKEEARNILAKEHAGKLPQTEDIGISKDSLHALPLRYAHALAHYAHSPSITAHSLDISAVDENIIDIMEVMEAGVLHKIFSPKNNHVFNAIMDGHTTLWKADGNFCNGIGTRSKNGKTVLLDLVINMGDCYEYKYYAKDGEEWKVIQKSIYYDILAGYRNTVVELDVGAINKSTLNVKQTRIQNIVKMVVSAKTGYQVMSVLDGQDILWTPRSNQEFVLISLYTLEGMPKLVDVFSKGKEFQHDHFIHIDHAWESVEENDFEAYLESLRVHDTKVDILAPDTSKMDVMDVEMYGVRGIQCTPKSGYRLVKVYENDMPIWVGDEDEETTGILIFHKNRRPFLADIIIANSLGYEFKLFQRNGTQWTPIDRVNYNEKFESLKVLETSVDISNVDESKMTMIEEPLHDVDIVSDSMEDVEFGAHPSAPQRLKYSLQDGYRLVEVKDGQESLWTAAKYEECESITIYSKEEPQVMELLISDRAGHYSRHFGIRHGKWVAIDEVEYNSAVDLLKTVDTTLDISNINRRVTDVYEDKINGIPYFEYKPKPGYRFISVANGINTLWKAVLNQECVHATLYTTGTSLLNLNIMDNHGDIDDYFEGLYGEHHMYYKESDGQWIWIGRREYEEEMAKLRITKNGHRLREVSEDQTTVHRVSSNVFGEASISPSKEKNEWVTTMDHADQYISAIAGRMRVSEKPLGDPEGNLEYTDSLRPVPSVPSHTTSQSVHILDLSEVTSRPFSYEKLIHVTRYSPNPTLERIVDGDKLIWEVTNGTISDALLYHKRDGSHYLLIHMNGSELKGMDDNCKYFMHVSYDWQEVGRELFYTSLEARIVTYASLDVCGPVPPEDLVETINVHPFGYPSTIYNSQPDVHITSVFCGDKHIWSSYGDEYCVSASLVDEDTPLLELFIKDKKETKRHNFELVNGEWMSAPDIGIKVQVSVDSFYMPSALAITLIAIVAWS